MRRPLPQAHRAANGATRAHVNSLPAEPSARARAESGFHPGHGRPHSRGGLSVAPPSAALYSPPPLRSRTVSPQNPPAANRARRAVSAHPGDDRWRFRAPRGEERRIRDSNAGLPRSVQERCGHIAATTRHRHAPAVRRQLRRLRYDHPGTARGGAQRPLPQAPPAGDRRAPIVPCPTRAAVQTSIFAGFTPRSRLQPLRRGRALARRRSRGAPPHPTASGRP